MSYATRTKDDPGDVGRSADQNQSIDNEEYLKGQLDALSGSDQVIYGFFSKTGLSDNVATDVFTVESTNEAGDNDKGAWALLVEGLAVVPDSSDHEHAVALCRARWAGVNAWDGDRAVVGTENDQGGHTSSNAGVVNIVSFTFGKTDTSDYVTTISATVDRAGTDHDPATVYVKATLIWWGYTTAPTMEAA